MSTKLKIHLKTIGIILAIFLVPFLFSKFIGIPRPGNVDSWLEEYIALEAVGFLILALSAIAIAVAWCIYAIIYEQFEKNNDA